MFALIPKKTVQHVSSAIGIFLIATVVNAASMTVAAESGASLRIGHYSSGDGMIGFVVDRLSTPVKLRFDGSQEIWALTPEPYPSNLLSVAAWEITSRCFFSGCLYFQPAGSHKR
jgi:hypothetical protein